MAWPPGADRRLAPESIAVAAVLFDRRLDLGGVEQGRIGVGFLGEKLAKYRRWYLVHPSVDRQEASRRVDNRSTAIPRDKRHRGSELAKPRLAGEWLDLHCVAGCDIDGTFFRDEADPDKIIRLETDREAYGSETSRDHQISVSHFGRAQREPGRSRGVDLEKRKVNRFAPDLDGACLAKAVTEAMDGYMQIAIGREAVAGREQVAICRDLGTRRMEAPDFCLKDPISTSEDFHGRFSRRGAHEHMTPLPTELHNRLAMNVQTRNQIEACSPLGIALARRWCPRKPFAKSARVNPMKHLDREGQQ
jgi:hypothetical protein